MPLTKFIVPALSALVLLSACSDTEVGATIENPTFGVSATQNRISQLAILNAGERAVSLQSIFEQEVEDTVYFEFNSAELGLPERIVLDQQVAWILSRDNARFEVAGHADRVGSPEYNAELGLTRANTVLDYLVSQGVPRARLSAVASFGEDEPAIDTEEMERLNRRVVTRILGTEAVDSGRGFDGRVAQSLYEAYARGDNFTLDAAAQVGQ